MMQQVSDFISTRLKQWKVSHIFGYSGDGNNGLMGALNRADDSISFVQPRHEVMAAFMACGYAKYTDEEWWGLLHERAMGEANPINPQRVFWEVSQRLPDWCLLCCDSGSATNWYARDLKFRSGMRGSVSGGLATMGNAIPYAIAAKFAYPERVSIAFVGDGAMQMSGNAELLTVSKYWSTWQDPRLIVIVLNNRDLNQVTWEMRVQDGDPKYEASQDLPAFSYAQYAELIGLKGIEVTDPEQIGSAWDEAIANNCPTVLDFHTDPDIPPIPPHISKQQAKAYMSAMLHGDPDALETIKASLSQFSKSFIAKAPRLRRH